MKVLGFLLGTTDRLVARVVLGALFGGLLAAGMTLLVASEGTQHWPPQQLTYVAMVTIAVFAAYATAVSVLLRAAASRLVREVAEAQHVEKVTSAPDHGALSS
jgi:ABC-type Fe3+-siderophore transport system permease subunit